MIEETIAESGGQGDLNIPPYEKKGVRGIYSSRL